MSKLLCSTRFPSLITALGSLPLYVYLVLSFKLHIEPLVAMLYVCGILNFVFGGNWLTACRHNKANMLLWSIALSLLSSLILLLYYLHLISSTACWLSLLALLWISLVYDYFHQHLTDINYYFCYRRSGTVFLSIAIILILIK